MADFAWYAVVIGILLVCVLLLFVLWRQGQHNGKGEERFNRFEEKLSNLEKGIRGQLHLEISQSRTEALLAAREDREEHAHALARLSQSLSSQVMQLGALQGKQLESFAQQLTSLTQSNEMRFEQLRQAVESRLIAMQTDNAAKLEEMRKTVDEKLHATLEQRLGESFKQVSDRLEQVHKGLGEMQNLAAGVGDLKKVLTNVKTRGTWGEVQLQALLDQILTSEQYQSNVATRPNSNDRVEFAICLPGKAKAGEENKPVFLPIDAKFPLEDYQRLIEAQERGDVPSVEAASKALEYRLKDEAKTIRDKYIEPPHTTDFAILYLPTEGLYAEALRRPGLSECLQNDYRITLAGPTTLAALLNSLQMGFRTLAIEKRSSEVWGILGAVKTEFEKFSDVLQTARNRLEQATNSIDELAGVRTRQIVRKLRKVEALPAPEAQKTLSEPKDMDDEI